MKGSFFRKKPMKGVGGILLNSGLRTVGGVAGAYAIHTIGPKVFKDMPKKYFGLGMLALGLAGEMFVQHENVRAFAEGLTVVGGLNATGQFVFKAPADLGLGEIESDGSGQSEAVDVEVYRKSLGAPDPLENLNKALDAALEKSMNGLDENGAENLPSNLPINTGGGVATGGGGGAAIPATINPSIQGIEYLLQTV